MILAVNSDGPDKTERIHKLNWASLSAYALRHVFALRGPFKIYIVVLVKWSHSCLLQYAKTMSLLIFYSVRSGFVLFTDAKMFIVRDYKTQCTRTMELCGRLGLQYLLF